MAMRYLSRRSLARLLFSLLGMLGIFVVQSAVWGLWQPVPIWWVVACFPLGYFLPAACSVILVPYESPPYSRPDYSEDK
jgi:hypothetical protein